MCKFLILFNGFYIICCDEVIFVIIVIFGIKFIGKGDGVWLVECILFYLVNIGVCLYNIFLAISQFDCLLVYLINDIIVVYIVWLNKIVLFFGFVEEEENSGCIIVNVIVNCIVEGFFLKIGVEIGFVENVFIWVQCGYVSFREVDKVLIGKCGVVDLVVVEYINDFIFIISSGIVVVYCVQ